MTLRQLAALALHALADRLAPTAPPPPAPGTPTPNSTNSTTNSTTRTARGPAIVDPLMLDRADDPPMPEEARELLRTLRMLNPTPFLGAKITRGEC